MEGDFIGQRALYNIEKLKSNEVTTPHTNEIEDAKVSVVRKMHINDIYIFIRLLIVIWLNY